MRDGKADQLENAENSSNEFLAFKPEFSRRLSRIFFSASSRLSRNFRGRLAGLAQIAAGGRLSRRLRELLKTHLFSKYNMTGYYTVMRPLSKTVLLRRVRVYKCKCI